VTFSDDKQNILFGAAYITELHDHFPQYIVIVRITNEAAYSVLLHKTGEASYKSFGENVGKFSSSNTLMSN
jgi:hypothetical protein